MCTLDRPETAFSHSDEGAVIATDVGWGRAQRKRGWGIVEVATGAIPLQPLNESDLSHAFKLTGPKVARGSKSLTFCISA